MPTRDVDCLLIGHNQMRFPEYVGAIRQMGERSGAHRDLRLSYYLEGDRVVSCREFCNQREAADGGRGDMSYDDMLSAGITYLGTFLHQRGLSFEYANSFQEEAGWVAQLLTTGRVKTIAILTTYYVATVQLREVIGFVRSLDPSVPIIVGGPLIRTRSKLHDKAAFRFLLRQLGADFYIVNAQGEQTLVDLVRAIISGGGWESLRNVAHRVGSDFHCNPVVEEQNDLGANMVDWSLFAPRAGRRTRQSVMVRTSISCPFSCSFCSFPTQAGAYRTLPPEAVWRDLDGIEAMGISSVTFVDDTFNVPIGRYRALLEGLARRKYSFRWNCNFRCQYATEEIVQLMKEAGCEGVFLGVEAGSDTILRNMNKQATVDAYERGILMLKAAGILTYASFIVGFPGETTETVQQTREFIQRNAPDFFRAQLWYFDALTPIADDAAHYGIRNSQFEWSHDTMTAGEAADWIDHLHATVTGSIWLPQNDFDFPALFCLTSRGWSTDRIKATVRDFNRRVARDLNGQDLESAGQHLDPELLRSSEFEF